MSQLSVFADEVTDDFTGQVKFLVEKNIGFIEIRFVNKKNIINLTKSELDEIKNMLDDNGIGVSAIASPIGKVKIDELFDIHLDKFKHTIELAQFFNTKFIRVFSYYPPEGKRIDDYRDEVIERMIQKVELLTEIDVIMVHENEAHIYGHSAENCLDLVKSINSLKFRLAYDPANFVWGQNIKNNVEVCWPLMKPYVAHVHIKDWKLGSKDVGSIPGTGDGQIRELLAELVKINYDGFITMEPHLKVGGQFGGETGPELFSKAVDSTLKICSEVGLKCTR